MAWSNRPAATMQDVAARAGVSVKTVSNVLSGYEHVSAKMRTRVMAAVDELSYEINIAARNLRVGRTHVIGLAIPELSQAYFAELADAVIRAAGQRGYTVLIEQTVREDSTEISAVSNMRKHSIDGLIYSPLTLAPADVTQLNVDFPVVVLGERVHGSQADHVTMSNAAATRAATTHVLELGRRRIAVLGVQPDGPVGTAASRLQGYEDALTSYGIEPDPKLFAAASLWHRRNGVEATERLIATGATFDAIVCFNDALALGALRALKHNGLRVPEDVSVVGFDDIEDSSYSTPSLSTISPRRDEIAQEAVALLVERIEGTAPSTAAREVVTGFALIVRESTLVPF
ncbi:MULTISPECIES: LacI family DNA-binding transcriptional regulator [Subtercola]|uniref:LacI family transcriptional regulator n=1 Tax=Subtercola vilae TaxID=2056433 RepID=A0A4T2C6P7_9MICO|nr:MULTISPECIES: LacI family DNA-binding transcriptional regulator [Subtercola]MEA9984339.1 LacI family DNA-binding transcriptional regulator [Subtercola sp. RTI3]TIH40093.1 LacI family transcriptional regulator [Subtercola vilae]